MVPIYCVSLCGYFWGWCHGYGQSWAPVQNSHRQSYWHSKSLLKICECHKSLVHTCTNFRLFFFFLSQLVGSCFTRTPAGSTERYTRWCNTLSPTQLHTQVTFTPSPTTHTHWLLQAFTAFGPTLIQPTWFCSRELVDKLGHFSEQGRVSYVVNVCNFF